MTQCSSVCRVQRILTIRVQPSLRKSKSIIFTGTCSQLNKTTFYRYYPTLDDLLEELQSEYARPYAEKTAGLRYPNDIEALIREFMTYSAQQGPLYDIILSSGAYAGIMQNVMDDMGEERFRDWTPPKGWSEDEWALYLTHVNSSQIRIYKSWVDGGRTIPIDRLVTLAIKLICDGARL